MQTLLLILIILAALATLYVLVRGVITMAQGKDIGGVQSQSLMRKRVMYQAVAIVFVILFLMLARGAGN
ncbi:HIG1 domain-containing protein [Allosphingosinicella indica]|uniref:Hypoxia induced protein conserved region n=1 Tax=Allosphingosinicella indica TaxID=941907 RepID=A0A1X7G6N3_9SPHN|nr:HIG1 domain-containing protein [Allosphingosinicella indica]SMF64801.1 Hypoxia induced protein conserved region [Allosphingosinicella indica]